MAATRADRWARAFKTLREALTWGLGALVVIAEVVGVIFLRRPADPIIMSAGVALVGASVISKLARQEVEAEADRE